MGKNWMHKGVLFNNINVYTVYNIHYNKAHPGSPITLQFFVECRGRQRHGSFGTIPYLVVPALGLQLGVLRSGTGYQKRRCDVKLVLVI